MNTGLATDAARDERGFTLIEMLIAMALIAVGVAATIGVFGASGRATVRAQRSEVGAQQAQAEIDRLSTLEVRRARPDLDAHRARRTRTNPRLPGQTGTNFTVTTGLTETSCSPPATGRPRQVDPGPDDLLGRLRRRRRSPARSTATSPGATSSARRSICDGTQNTKRVIGRGHRRPDRERPGSAPRSGSPPIDRRPERRSARDTRHRRTTTSSGAANTSAQIFYLYDTPLRTPTRPAWRRSASHNTHNTAPDRPGARSTTRSARTPTRPSSPT